MVEIILKLEQCGFYYTVMHPKDADGMAISVDPDPTAPEDQTFSGSGSTLFIPDLSVRILTVIFLSFRTDRSGQTVQT